MTDRVQSSSGPRDGSNTESPTRSVEMPMFTRPHEPTGIPGIGVGLLPASSFASGRVLLGSYGRQVDPLAQWYETNDGPWIPKGIAPPQNGEQQSMRVNGVSIRNHGYNFAGPYRESISPSECDTVPTGMMPSDSGYGSNGAKQSVATASVYDEAMDRSQETQSLAGHLSDLHFQFGMDASALHKGSFPGNWSHQQQGQPPTIQRSAQSDGKELRCETCKKELKTNSELKKHRQRHTKPYTCEVLGCQRTEGFSTRNDLDRHIRSVHPDRSATGNRYRCPFGTCVSKDKIWPRADNFRAHIKRVHSKDIRDEDLEAYVIRPTLPPLPPQDVLTDLVGMQTPAVDYNFAFSPSMDTGFPGGYWQHELNKSAVLDLSQETCTDRILSPSQAGSAKASGQVVEVVEPENHVGTEQPRSEQGTISGPLDTFLGRPERPRQFMESSASISDRREEDSGSMQYVAPEALSQRIATASTSSLSEPSSPHDIKQSLESPRTPQDPPQMHLAKDLVNNTETDNEADLLQRPNNQDEKSIRSGTSDPSALSTTDVSSLVKDPEKLKQILEALQTNGVLKELGYKKETSPSPEPKVAESVASPRPEPQNVCTTCKKTFFRPCELKKHMKRHEKPYGCTFQGCNKRFGSKNDWKRHENSQHFLLEVWRCDGKKSDKPAEACGKVSHRRETFRQHLASNHRIQGDAIEQKLEECRVGRNCEARFWCGFCQEIIEIKQKGLHAWTERFNHIDDHFSGRNELPRKQIDDWKNVDPEAPPVVDASGSDSDEDSPPPSTSLSNTTRPGGNLRARQQSSRYASLKRKASDAEDGRDSKRTKGDDPIMRVTNCCQCGERNQSTLKMSQQCISSLCQHFFCSNCS